MNSIAENLQMVRQNIAEAAAKASRRADEITLIGVTKTVDVERIQALLALGVCHLGENRVQELLDKYPLLGDLPQWHMIGHLQTNKVKPLIGKAVLIHSVDSLRLAEEIGRRAVAANDMMDVLVEINVAEEPTKSGVSFAEARELVRAIAEIAGVRCRGLMTVAPNAEDGEKNRDYFKKMQTEMVDINAKK